MVEFITMAPTSGDGTYVGTSNTNAQRIDGWTASDESAERPPTLEYIRAVAQAAEKGGFSTLLLPTGGSCLDSLSVAANLTAYTENLNFLFAVRPGSTQPAVFAKQFATVDYWSGGRARVNIVTGGQPKELASDGDFLDHTSRYKRTKEYIQVLKRLFTEDGFDHEGEFFTLKNASLFPKPVQKPRPEIYFGGASEIGKQVAAEDSDVYMMWGETLENSRERINEMKKLAKEKDRQLSYSISFQVILGETEEEAWNNANRLVSKLSPELASKKSEQTKKEGDSTGVKRLHQLMEQGKENNFIIGPNLWAGLTQVISGNSIALVGTPDQVADRLIEYVNLGFDKVLLRGFPHLETIEQIGELVIPRVHSRLKEKALI
ncbi:MULTISPECIES: LLM class flavin-dependent oxidoreductase [Bacillus]|uniref:Alkanesulfonate monooxygenase n=2 Tax=Bacillus TaxID=1386 RepID=A0A0M5JI29_9BACI|nr:MULTISPECIES: LLM class flavin-dependent oxidoreductase [Bacillus]ALC80257.1 alkanesulfonate monooxygenase [Bacillus gobiensis]MBP1083916.1 alkanesulfonate monooxygenase [Bacillus capparidis]MED1098394.1 LLM class flavin-dependent oxidoreductase [Bacillus capparidis]